MIRQSGSGFISIPMRDGTPMSEEQYKQLPNNELAKIKEKSSELEEKVVEFTNEFTDIEEEMEETIEQLDEKDALDGIGHLIERLQQKYASRREEVDDIHQGQVDCL